ncbi:zinc-dependent metalloprotease [Taibaiella koreensis]|uniref:zinc-dependent metalloprotease n=1 Tax=Taibaiella koreensis TaxID=1268548 RepID=UPI000E599AF3|nr:zinc-dependent metalloprotease family protein [Taibaiella koreensis]
MHRKFTLLFAAFTVLSQALFAGISEYWQPVHPDLVKPAGMRRLSPDHYQTYTLRFTDLREQLLLLSTDPARGATIVLPTPDGGSRTFRIWQSPMMEPALAAKYPELKTFTAEATDDRRVTAKLNLGPDGFHAYVYNGAQTYLIDPYSDVEDGNYLCYFRKDYTQNQGMPCGVTGGDTGTAVDPQEGTALQRTYGTQRRNYRLALACTGEYATAVGGTTPTKASVLAQMVLIMNRVNGVYERELAATMTLVGNTDTLIFLNGATDPYTNNDPNALLTQNQATVDSRIGSAGYDIGHVFTTGGGGLAGLGVLCNNSAKAEGETGLPSPFGDPFAIDFVAHEMGHQFGSNHTYNSSQGNCGGNGESTMAFEVGSGSTIMAYAGICNGDDLQPHSDAYFHAVSLRNITNYIGNAATGGSCPTVTASVNIPNTYPDFTASYSIPVWTPFELTAPAVTDATMDTLNYCWEEWDLGGFGQTWNAVDNTMPYFRSFNPSASPVRVLPSMNNVLAGNYFYKGERLPTAARTLKFILTTRDIYQGWGCFNASFDTDTITLNVVSLGPDTFKVSSQATAATWNTGSTQTITWNVANTTAAPINAANVDIFLSVDSGRTFPYTLATAVPNTGGAAITVPTAATASTKARVKVKGSGNVFFQVNRANITINVVPLPVTLQSFTASPKGCGIALQWTTSNERHFDHFELERSNDGIQFDMIARISSGNGNIYGYEDKALKDGDYYYRLRMVDADASFAYSPVASTRLSCHGQNSVAVFPNPAKDKVTIRTSNAVVQLNLSTVSGQLLLHDTGLQVTEKTLDLKGLATGIYLLQLRYADGSGNTVKLVRE